LIYHYSIALLESGEELLLKNISFTQFLTVLLVNDFCQINKKEIIAVMVVAFFTHDELTTSVIKSGKPALFTLTEVYKTGFLEKKGFIISLQNLPVLLQNCQSTGAIIYIRNF
jgi:two-component system, LytTR family, response regulator